MEHCNWEEGVEEDYLDIKFNVEKNEYEPYKKKNDNTKYLSVDSDHPEVILKGIPNIMENRINMLSSSKEIFDKKKIEYEDAMKNKAINTYHLNIKMRSDRRNITKKLRKS